MTRGVKGLYIYACDEELRKALKEAASYGRIEGCKNRNLQRRTGHFLEIKSQKEFSDELKETVKFFVAR